MYSKIKKLTKKELNFLSDEELIEIKEKEKLATEVLIERYKRMARIKANKYYAKGADVEDIIQEAMIGIFEAVLSYNSSYKTSFKTFVNLIMDRKIYNLIHKHNNKKNSLLSESISISEELENKEYKDFDSLDNINPSSILIDMENVERLNDLIEKNLSELEKEVFDQYIKGFTYTEISSYLSIEEKAVDNAIQRIRRKLRK